MNETLLDDNIVSLRLNYLFIPRFFIHESVTHVTRHFYSLCKQTARFSRLLLIKDNSSIKSFFLVSAMKKKNKFFVIGSNVA